MKLIAQILTTLALISFVSGSTFAATKVKTSCFFISKDGKKRKTNANLRLMSDDGEWITHNGRKSFLVSEIVNNDILESCRDAITSHNYGSSSSMIVGIKAYKSLWKSYPVVYNRLGFESDGNISNATNCYLAHGTPEAHSKISEHVTSTPYNGVKTVTSFDLASSDLENYLGLKKQESAKHYDLSTILPYAVASNLAYKFEKRISENFVNSFDQQFRYQQFNKVIDEFHPNFADRFIVILFEKQTSFSTASIAFYDLVTEELIVSYKGTKPSFFSDIFADLGITSYFNDLHKLTSLESYKKNALYFYDKAISMSTDMGLKPLKKIVTGHSLGGFLATYVAVRKNADFAKVFSAPGLHDIFDKENKTKNILNVYIDTDPVVQFTGLMTPRHENLLIFPPISKKSSNNHKLGNIIVTSQ